MSSILCLPLPLAPNYTTSSCMNVPDVFVRGAGVLVIGGLLTESPAEPFCKARLIAHYPDQSYDVKLKFFSLEVTVYSNVKS